MIADFYLGLLVATTVALGLIVTVGLSLLAWFIQWLSKFGEIRAVKDKKGAVGLTVDVRAK